MRNNKFVLKVVTTFLITVFVLGACTPAPTAAPAEPTMPPAAEPTKAPEATAIPPEPTKAPMDKVTMRTAWKWKAAHAPFVLADDKGFFEEQNIDIEILEGASSGEVIPLVAQKQADFSIPSLTTTAIAISQDIPVVSIMSIMAKNAVGLAYFKDDPLNEPKDLEGKSIALSPGEAFAMIYPAFAEKWEIDTSKVTTVALDIAVKNQQFMDGGIDVLPVYINNEFPALKKQSEKEIDVLLPADWGFNTLSDGVIAHPDMIKNNPDLVRRFLAAVTKGFMYANEHPEEALAAIKARSDALAEQPDEIILEQIKLTLDLAFGAEDKSKPFGWMEDSDWDRTLAPLLDAGKIEKKPDYSALYTNDFLVEK